MTVRWNAIVGPTFARETTRGWGLSLPNSYREYAAECLRLAQSATTEDDRARLVSMAQAWRELADKLDGLQREGRE